MFNSAILDVAIGLSFIFLLFSLLVTAICELFAGVMKWRAEHLWRGLEQLLQSTDARDALYEHPLIRGLSPMAATVSGWKQGHNGPSYIPSRTFALALLDVLQRPHRMPGAMVSRLQQVAAASASNPAAIFDAIGRATDDLSATPALASAAPRLADLKRRVLAYGPTDPDGALRELRTTLAQSNDVRYALDHADASLQGLAGSLLPLLDD